MCLLLSDSWLNCDVIFLGKEMALPSSLQHFENKIYLRATPNTKSSQSFFLFWCSSFFSEHLLQVILQLPAVLASDPLLTLSSKKSIRSSASCQSTFLSISLAFLWPWVRLTSWCDASVCGGQTPLPSWPGSRALYLDNAEPHFHLRGTSGVFVLDLKCRTELFFFND